MRITLFSCVLVASMMSVHCSSPKSIDQLSAKTSTIKVLIIDGENNHGTWPKTTAMIRDYLEETGLFQVEVKRKAFIWQGPHADEVLGAERRDMLLEQYPLDDDHNYTRVEEPKVDPNFHIDFSQYDVVISNLGWKASEWPMETKNSFEEYMDQGGGLVIIHAANNSFGDWPEFNKMIGLGGWGGRDVKSGPYVYYDENDRLIRDKSEGACGSHGPRYEFVLETRASDHPIMKGLPTEWIHTKDELYDRLRGPAENMTVLATAFSDIDKNGPPWAKDVKGTGRHEPMLMAVEYGKGRVFHTGLGHNDYSMECVGFITTLQRGTEWAATGSVSQPVPKDFPTKDQISSRPWSK